MKVIFLDIDGVLNCATTIERQGGKFAPGGIFGIDPVFLDRFHKLVEDTQAKIVLSSSWRMGSRCYELLSEGGVDISQFVGETPRLYTAMRGDEIKQYLEEHQDVTDYAIIDDDSDFYADQHLFKTSWKTGLTDEICDKIRVWFDRDKFTQQ